MSLLERLEKQKAVQHHETREHSHAHASAVLFSGNSAQLAEYADIKQKIHAGVITIINEEMDTTNQTEAERSDFVHRAIETVMAQENADVPRALRARFIEELYNDIVGLGPLEPLLADPDITEVMVNGYDKVYVEIRGKIEATDIKFRDNNHVMNIINRIVSSVGRRIDEASPMVDARLADGSRVNAVIPPVSLSGPTITIRKFSKQPLGVSDLIRFSSVSPQMMAFLEACVKARMNIIVSGGTGSGKTTLLSVLSGYIPENERIVTIEDAAELRLQQRHVITLESRPANIEGAGQITIRDLVRNALRMRPDRIVVGEVRSGETLDMLQAMNTGHDGSLTTAHANSPRDLISRLETMVLMSGMDMPVAAIREQVSSALNLIVHQARMRDGSRKIVSITEVVGMEGDTVTLQDIYVYKPAGIGGSMRDAFVATGTRPTFVEKMADNGIMVKDEWFQN
ncbi:MAG: CpaF family protein [Oscillospiraceae bacterium]|nr:CpaF family protein [Oscillospiraceae bacterium]